MPSIFVIIIPRAVAILVLVGAWSEDLKDRSRLSGQLQVRYDFPSLLGPYHQDDRKVFKAMTLPLFPTCTST